MTAAEREHEIASRMEKLSHLRGDLMVAKKRLQCEQKKLNAASPKNYYHTRPEPGSWISAEEMAVLFDDVENLKSEMKELISELDALGVNGKLFQVETMA